MFTLYFTDPSNVTSLGWKLKSQYGNVKVWAFQEIAENELEKYLNLCKDEIKNNLMIVLPKTKNKSQFAQFAKLADKIIEQTINGESNDIISPQVRSRNN